MYSKEIIKQALDNWDKIGFGGNLMELIGENYECFKKSRGVIEITGITDKLIADLADLANHYDK